MARNAYDAGGRPVPGPAPDDTLESESVFRGRVVDLYVDTVRFPDGSIGKLEMMRHSGASAVLPVLGDPAASDPRILLIRQHRHGAGGFMLEVPAGRPDRTGEPWEDVAARELEEETGHIAGRLTYLTSIFTAASYTNELIRLYTATDLRPGRTSLDAHEYLEPVATTLAAALAMVRSGEIVDAKTICTLLYVAMWGVMPGS